MAPLIFRVLSKTLPLHMTYRYSCTYRYLQVLQVTYMLNEGTDNSIIEVVYVLPLYPLKDVFFLLRFECELYEHLLQFFVTVVDNELLETVIVENLKAIDV